MNLGPRPLPVSRFNCLADAIHPRLGAVWTDGTQLSLVKVVGCVVEQHPLKAPLKNGDHVLAAAWNFSNGEEDLLGVLTGSSFLVLGVTSLGESVIRLGHLPSSRRPTGIVWNPVEVFKVCVLYDDAVAVATVRPSSRIGSTTFCIVAEFVSSGGVGANPAAWSPSGSSLFFGVGRQLFTWAKEDDIDSETSKLNVTFKGDIVSITSPFEDRLLVATSADLLSEATQSDSDIRLVSPISLGTVLDDGDVSFKGQPIQKVRGAVSRDVTARLLLLARDGDSWRVVDDAVLPGILSPDLMAFDAATRSVIVGGNSADLAYSLKVSEDFLGSLNKFALPGGCHLKGVTSAVGFGESISSTFLLALSSSSTSILFPPSSSVSSNDVFFRFLDSSSPSTELYPKYSDSDGLDPRSQEIELASLGGGEAHDASGRDDDENLKSLMRDCIFALRKSNTKRLEENQNGLVDSRTESGLDLLMRDCAVAAARNTDGDEDSEKDERSSAAFVRSSSTITEACNGSIEPVTLSKRGPIYVTELLKAKSQDTSKLGAEFGLQSGIEIGHSLKAVPFTNTKEYPALSIPLNTRSTFEPDVDLEATLRNFDERLNRIEKMLTRRFSKETVPSSLKKLDERISKIERLVEKVCDDA